VAVEETLIESGNRTRSGVRVVVKVSGADPEAAEKLVQEFITAFVGADYERLESLVSEDFSITWMFHESGSVEPDVRRRLVGRGDFMEYARNGTSSCRYWYDDPVLRPTADGLSVYMESGATMILPKDPSAEPELEYHQQLVFRFDVRDGLLTQQIFWHNPVAAVVGHNDRRLPTLEELEGLGRPGTFIGKQTKPIVTTKNTAGYK
jgi:hypothetical protein